MIKTFEKFKEEHPDIFSSLKDIFDEATKSAETSSATMEETMLQQIMRNPIFACPTIEEDGFHITKKDWYFILLNIITGQPLLLTGPTGTGKTEIIKLACRKLGLPLHKYDMGGIHDPMEQLLGSHRLRDGNSYFDYSQFALDIQEKGVILLDELSRAPAETNNILLPLLDDTKLLKVEMAGGRDMRSIPVHPECTFIATANIGDEYSGVQKIDEALSDRFLVMEMDYLPEAAEIKVLVKRTEITESQAKIIVKLSHDVREMKKKGEIYGQHSLSTRETLQAARLAHLGYSVKDAIERAFLTRFEGNDLEGDRAIVKALMATL